MSYYKHHVFFCTNKREPDPDGTTRPCCADKGAVAIRDYAKKSVKRAGLSGAGAVRVNNAGCLDRCEEGPCVVIYPEGVWYKIGSREAVDAVLETHLRDGRRVDALFLPPGIR